MSIDYAAIDTALTGALPALAATILPTLAITAGVAIHEWHRLTDDDDGYSIDDYKPTPAPAQVRHYRPQPVDAPTQVLPRILPDAGTPLYEELTARRTARKWLTEIATVNGVNTGEAL